MKPFQFRVASSTGMYWNILGFFLVLGFVLGIWEIAKLYWDVPGKLYFNKEKKFHINFNQIKISQREISESFSVRCIIYFLNREL